MAPFEVVRLYRSPSLPGHWIGEDKRGGLVTWPDRRGGWDQRTPYTGPRRGLEAVEPALARGSGWPGVKGARRPRAASGLPGRNRTVRASDDEWAAWTEAAGERSVSDWLRELANGAARRARR